jgi:hypothetical protein
VSVPTVDAAAAVYGADGVPLDDPAELFHEASKLSPRLGATQMRGAVLFEASTALQASSIRSVKRNDALPVVPLPPAELPAAGLDELVAGRRSDGSFGGGPLTLDELSSLSYAAYGVTGHEGPPLRRAVPSGGALYPLELYWLVEASPGVGSGIFHYDPLRHEFEVVRSGSIHSELEGAFVMPELSRGWSATLAISAMFWRSRFKENSYGQLNVLRS